MFDCKFFSSCGGCSYLDLDEGGYRDFKKSWLEGVLREVAVSPLGFLGDGGIDYVWIGSKSRRRIAVQVSFDNKIGFFKRGSKELVEIDECEVACEEISRFLPILRVFLVGFEQNLVTRVQVTSFDNVLDVVFFAKRELNRGQERVLAEFGAQNGVNVSCGDFVFGEVVPVIAGLRVDSEVFLQATKEGLIEIIAQIREFVALKKPKKVVEIYSGFGAYSFGFVDLVDEILALEGSEKMVDLVEKNATRLGLNGKIKAQSRDLFKFPLSFLELKGVDLVVINPPRNGAGPQIREIADSKVKNLVYVSCNVRSFVRDLRILLDAGFVVDKVVAIDQFVGGEGFELVVWLGR